MTSDQIIIEELRCNLKDAVTLRDFYKRQFENSEKENKDLRDQIESLGVLVDVKDLAIRDLKSALKSAVCTIDYWQEFDDISKMDVDLDRVREINRKFNL